MQRLSDKYPPKAVKSAVDKLTVELELTALNGRKLVAVKGYDSTAREGYKERLTWLRRRHRKINDWVKDANRSDVQLAVCNSIFATHKHYGMILKQLIKYCDRNSEKKEAQPSLIDFGTIRSGEQRYVKN
jgi:hypothetical protein